MSKTALVSESDHESALLRPIELPPLPEQPLISVLVLSYNYATFMGAAIDSVLQQTYAHFEVVVCDDGSTDNSCEIVEGYARRDARVRLRRKANGGVISAVNVAYRESRGEIICLLDADDRYLPCKLEAVVGAFRGHPDAGYLVHRIVVVDEQGRAYGVRPVLWEPPSGWYGETVLRTGESPPGLVPTVGLCLRREVADRILPLPEKYGKEGIAGWDTAISGLALLTTRVVGIPEAHAEYRFHGTNFFTTARFGPELLRRGRRGDQMRWEIEHQYLARISPRLAEVFPPLEQHMGYQRSVYIGARLSGEAGAFRAYRSLLRTRRFAVYPLPVRWFWRASILLPRPLFRLVVYALWGRGGKLRTLFFQLLRRARRGNMFAGSR